MVHVLYTNMVLDIEKVVKIIFVFPYHIISHWKKVILPIKNCLDTVFLHEIVNLIIVFFSSLLIKLPFNLCVFLYVVPKVITFWLFKYHSSYH